MWPVQKIYSSKWKIMWTGASVCLVSCGQGLNILDVTSRGRGASALVLWPLSVALSRPPPSSPPSVAQPCVSGFNFLLPCGRCVFPSHLQISQRNPEQHFNLPLGVENAQKSRSYLASANSAVKIGCCCFLFWGLLLGFLTALLISFQKPAMHFIA